MIKLSRKRRKIEKLNLIPIMDAVFIFIFFLLMSAQFLEVYEIGSDAPAVSTITEEQKDKKPPLNLTLVISRDKIVVKTGIEENTYKTINKTNEGYELDALREVIVEIKTKHVDENSVILRPKTSVPYSELVKIMDTVRNLEKNDAEIVAKNKAGNEVKTKKLFDQIIFETLI